MPPHPENIKSKYLEVVPRSGNQPDYRYTKRLNNLYLAYLKSEISDREFSYQVDELIAPGDSWCLPSFGVQNAPDALKDFPDTYKGIA